MSDVTKVLRGVGPRLRALRTEHGITLEELAERTDISVSTLSRLETCQRKPTLEMLLSLSQHYQVPLDDLVGMPEPEDPRIRLQPRQISGGRTVWPLSSSTEGVQAWKIELPPASRPLKLHEHDGYEWFYVLSGTVRLVLGEQDLELEAGEAVEFDTRVPHWFGSANHQSAVILSLFGRHGERVHVRD
ncbi:MAG TPA: helix-turn-helix transcriptional regulator [Propionibacterium sp.]|jgi:transcriptional regulator with XRE-family HTH domain|nr:helix-turn-helix transcriptional regulator [Propionibacterium sp.]